MRAKIIITRLAAVTAVAATTWSVVVLTSTGPAAASFHGRAAGSSTGAPYVPGEVVVGYRPASSSVIAHATATTMGLRAADSIASGEQVLRLPAGVSVPSAVARLRRTPGVAYAVPNYRAHVAGSSAGRWVPDDPGRGAHARGWQSMQWNFMGGAGADVPVAWSNLRTEGHPGGRGVVVAIVDTGVAYRRWHGFRRSPDFDRTRFVAGRDFVAHNGFPLDREGHGTFVAGTVAESTNNGRGVTGIAYGATIMPVRVLDRDGWGNAATISKGIRYAVRHGAQVINLSLEFDPSVNGAEIPDILSALRFAHRRGVVVVAASGNEGDNEMAYPARAGGVISVGATTQDRCLAAYSNTSRRMDLVAPGGGPDASGLNEANCHPYRRLPSIFQMTFPNPSNPRRFGFPTEWYGTSMAAPHVTGVAALVIASGVIGRHPTPAQVLSRLESTAQPLGGAQPNAHYGYGLVDAGAATAPPSG
ncbi:MAG: S8 family serine peptidase [Solirubrobacteraceae bacterium]